MNASLPWPARAVEAVAGLLTAGVLALGVVLLLAQIVLPIVNPHGVPAHGPGWAAVAGHLIVGAAGEATRAERRSQPVGTRSLNAAVGVAAVVLTVAVLWWR